MTTTRPKPQPVACLPEPCATCPYRRDVPSGVWDASEYQKLPQYDEGAGPCLNLFLCHATTNTACRGWLSVHRESVAVRFAVAKGEIHPDAPYQDHEAKLFSTGAEAAAHGLRNIARPKRAARAAIAKLERQIAKRAARSES